MSRAMGLIMILFWQKFNVLFSLEKRERCCIIKKTLKYLQLQNNKIPFTGLFHFYISIYIATVTYISKT